MIKFYILSFFILLILLLSLNIFLKIQDRWKRTFAEDPTFKNFIIGIVIPATYILIVITPSYIISLLSIKYWALEINPLWAIPPLAIMLAYALVYKSDEVSKVYSKIDKNKLKE